MTCKDLVSKMKMIIAEFPVLTQACLLIQLLFYKQLTLGVIIRKLRIQVCTKDMNLLGNIVGVY